MKSKKKFDYAQSSYDEIDSRAMRLLVSEVSELTAILRGHLLIERVIETLIAPRLKNAGRFFQSHRVSFDMKVDLAYSLGVLPQTHVSAAKALNKIRNAYAHNEDHQLSFEELNALKIKWVPIQDRAYEVSRSKGIAEAASLAVIFLNWSFQHLLPQRGQVRDT